MNFRNFFEICLSTNTAKLSPSYEPTYTDATIQCVGCRAILLSSQLDRAGQHRDNQWHLWRYSARYGSVVCRRHRCKAILRQVSPGEEGPFQSRALAEAYQHCGHRLGAVHLGDPLVSTDIPGDCAEYELRSGYRRVHRAVRSHLVVFAS